ncbi:transposase [Candidatus Nomurabacteria bacterium]|nr:transposase [Candidatus Nomurabacteria bacterium]
MPRPNRIDVGGEVYHCLNRSVGRQKIFHNDSDYRLFESVLEEVHDITSVDILAYTVMPNHWHLVLRPKLDGDLSDFMKRLTVTHTQRYRVKTKTVGTGPIYQGRYKSFLIQEDKHLLTVLRYVERNPIAAKLVSDPLKWKYGSVSRRYNGSDKEKELLTSWPIAEPAEYFKSLSVPLTAQEYEKVARSKEKGVPYGSDAYVINTVERYKLQSTLRGRGRPRQV